MGQVGGVDEDASSDGLHMRATTLDWVRILLCAGEELASTRTDYRPSLAAARRRELLGVSSVVGGRR